MKAQSGQVCPIKEPPEKNPKSLENRRLEITISPLPDSANPVDPPAKCAGIRQKKYVCLAGIGVLAAVLIVVISAFVQMVGQNGTQPNVTTVIPSTTPFRLLPVNQGSPSTLGIIPSATLWKSNGAHEYLIIYEGKTWGESQRICASHGTSLVILDIPEEEAFLRKTENLHECWVGLRRENIHSPWRYLNGTVFDNRFQIGNRMGLCAYWNLYGVSSTTCDNIRPCICRRAS